MTAAQQRQRQSAATQAVRAPMNVSIAAGTNCSQEDGLNGTRGTTTIESVGAGTGKSAVLIETRGGKHPSDASFLMAMPRMDRYVEP